TYPVIRLTSAVITRLEERAPAAGDLFAALVDRAGRWVAPALVAGFGERVDGLASTITTDFNILALGRSPAAMARAVNRLRDVRAAPDSRGLPPAAPRRAHRRRAHGGHVRAGDARGAGVSGMGAGARRAGAAARRRAARLLADARGLRARHAAERLRGGARA